MSNLRLSLIISAVDRLTQPVRRITQNTERLTGRIQQQQQRMQQSARINSTAAAGIGRLAASEQRLRQSTERTTQALDRRTQSLNRMKDARRTLEADMMKTAGLAAAGFAGIQLGRGAAGMLAGPIRTAADFEEAMSGVGAVSRANAEQLAALTAKAKELGATTRYSAAESAAGMKYLAMAGFSTEQIMASLPGVMNMATAGATDLGRASDISSDILSAFGLKASEMGRVADTLTATFTRSNTNLEMLGETMKYVGPVARNAGMSLEETAAMAGLLGNVGIKASQAGTTLRAMLQRLANPTGNAATTLQNLGIEVTDLEGNIRSVPEILGEMAGALENMGSGERLAALGTIFDAEAAAGVSELIAQEGAAGITKFVEVLKQAGGESARVAGQMSDNANGGFKAMNSAVEGLKIAFGDLLLPAVRSLTSFMTGLTRRLTAFTQQWPTLSKWLGYGVAALAGLAFAFGGLASVMAGVLGAMVAIKFAMSALGIKTLFASGALKGLVLGFVSMAARAIPVAIAGIKSLGIALMTTPVGLIISGIALAAGLIIANWDRIGPWFAGLWNGITGLFSKGWAMIQSVFSFSPLGLVMKAWQPMLDWISDKVGWIGDAFSSISGFFGGDDERSTGSSARQVGVAATVSAAVAATPVAAQPAATPISQQNQYTISIQQQPGENSNELAERVMQRIREREAVTRAGAQYDDY